MPPVTNTTELADIPRAEALVDPANLQEQVGLDLIGGSLLDECKRSELMGNLVQGASPLLFPCAIEYSLICAAILYVMWKNVAAGHDKDWPISSHSSAIARRSRHHYSVDCAKANKGLFAGIFVFVLTIISLIMFFTLINHPDYTRIAVLEVGVVRFVLFCLTFCATLIGIIQVNNIQEEILKCTKNNNQNVNRFASCATTRLDISIWTTCC